MDKRRIGLTLERNDLDCELGFLVEILSYSKKDIVIAIDVISMDWEIGLKRCDMPVVVELLGSFEIMGIY